MSENLQVKAGSGLDLIKWASVFLLIALGVYGNSYFSAEYSAYQRALPLIFLLAVCVFLSLQTVYGASFGRLVKESRAEIRRVVWPTRQEATQTTLVVALVVFIMALILWALDWSLNQLISLIIG